MKMKGRTALHGVTLRALWRRKGSSLLLALVVALGVFSSLVLNNLITRQLIALEKTVNETVITCVVTDPMGIDSSNLHMISAFVEMLTGRRHHQGCYLDEHVKNVRAKATVSLETPENYFLRRILSFDSDTALSEIEGVSINLYDGWTEEAFKTLERICLIPEGYQTQRREDGTEFVTIEVMKDETVELQVIGTVSGGPTNIFYCPFFMMSVDGVTELIYVETCSFDIADNSRLEECKAAIFGDSMGPTISFVEPDLSNRADGMTYGVLVQDEIYKKTIEEIESNLSMLRLLLPVLMVMCGGIGFFASYLATRNRTKEFAVMRCLGMKQIKIFGLVFEELLILTLLGGVAGFAAGFFMEGTIERQAILNAALITGIFLLGAAISAIRVTSVNVIKLMKAED